MHTSLQPTSIETLARMDSKYRSDSGYGAGQAQPAQGIILDRRPQHASLQEQKRKSVAGAANDPSTTNIPRLLSPVSQRRTPTDGDIGWAAGLFDGEGCIHIARQVYKDRRPNYRMRLYVAQNNLMVLQEFEWCVGISGRIYSPKPKGETNKTCHSLTYHGVQAFHVLECLVSHLRRKQPEAKLAAEFRERCDIHAMNGPNGCPEAIWDLRHWYYERMSDLKWA